VNETVASYFEALNGHDVDAAVDLLDPDVVEDVTGIGVLRGRDEVHHFFDTLFKAAPDMEVLVDRTVSEGDTTVVQWRMNGTFTGGPLFNGVQATGGRLALRGCDVIDVRDGKIVRNAAFQDGIEVARTIGMLPPQDSAAEKAMVAAFNGATKLRTAVRERFSGS
jgi:steroid delta-isomerase-like uncharacterized protein